MINLLPNDRKQEYLFARRNTSLLRFIIGVLIGIIFVIFVILFGYTLISSETKAYNDAVKSSASKLSSQDEQQTIAKVKEISNNLNLMVKVLNQQVLFSELLKQLGAVMPNGTSLKNLSLNESLAGKLDLEVAAIDYASAAQAQINIQDPSNKLFKSADTIYINCTQKDPVYPCLALIKTTFAPDNSFMLLSKNQGKTNE